MPNSATAQVADGTPLIGQPPISMRLTAIHYAARDTNLYEFRGLAGERLPAAEPGAHIDICLPNGLMRQYSLVAADPTPRSYVVGVKRDRESRGGSRYIHDRLRVGEVLAIGRPRNNFPLVEDAEHVVLFAGGIGITPIRSMVGRLVALGRSWELHYSCRSRSEGAFLDELTCFQELKLHVDDEHDGDVLDLAPILAAAPKGAHLYCCGPAAMLRAFEVATASWPRKQVHLEYFLAKHTTATEGGFVVALARSGREFVVPAGSTILDVLRDTGVAVASSCEQGVCGTCEVVVVAGVPDHRDVVLTDDERAANNRMMICCSGSKTGRLVLDL
jgi:ferredoxin-NADP reductase